jgi:interleukin-1 receptor-associated kinase 1
LSWNQRYNILCGVVVALAYLHEEWEQCILHKDIKPRNVLLDSKFNAYLGDFGMAQLLEHNKKGHTTFVVGTMGYLALELLHTRKANIKTYIFSFGVLMLEVTCGRQPFNPNLPEEEVYLLDWVWSLH